MGRIFDSMASFRWPQFLMVKGNPDKKQGSTTSKLPSRVKAADIATWIGFVILLFLIGWTLITDVEQIQPHSVIVIPKPYNVERELRADINLFSPTFGAGSNITLYATVYPDEVSKQEFIDNGRTFTTDKSGTGLPPRYLLLLEGSYCGEIPDTREEKYERSYACAMPMEFWPSEMYYRNFTSIVYPVEGEYGILLNEALPERTREDSIEYHFIEIASLETRINYVNAKYIWIATMVTIYVGSVSVYLQLRKGWITNT